jgi:phenylacetate-coenzyme A ligase PaaK-like adenylate-forming protein
VEMATDDPDTRGRIAGRIEAAIHEELGVRADVEALSRDTLPRAGYKAKRIVDPG